MTISEFISSYVFPVVQWGGWGLFGALLWYVFKHGEKVDKWISRFNGFLMWLGINREKKYVAGDIRWRINSASKKINKEAEGIVTKGVDIVWVDQENVESFLRSGKVMIRMRHHSNQDRNISTAVMHYVKTGVLHTGKIYLPDKIKEALNLSLTKKILSEESDKGTSLEYFCSNELDPLLKNDKEIEKQFSTIELMEYKGLLTRILLREIRALGKKIYPKRPNDEILKETQSFFNFLEPFANHRGGDNDIKEWQFLDKNIQIGILYVAKQTKLDCEGLNPYVKQIDKKIKSGCKKIYVFGRRGNNVVAIKELLRLIEDQITNIKINREYYSEIRGEKVPAICATISIKD